RIRVRLPPLLRLAAVALELLNCFGSTTGGRLAAGGTTGAPSNFAARSLPEASLAFASASGPRSATAAEASGSLSAPGTLWRDEVGGKAPAGSFAGRNSII